MRVIINIVDYKVIDESMIIIIDKKENVSIDLLFDMAFSDVRCDIGEEENGDFIFRCPKTWRKGLADHKVAIQND